MAKHQEKPEASKPLLHFKVSCVVGDPEIGAVKYGEHFDAATPGEAAAQFIDKTFKHPDASPVSLLQIDKLLIERLRG